MTGLHVMIMLIFCFYCSFGQELETGVQATTDCSDAYYWKRIPGKQLFGGIESLLTTDNFDECKYTCRFGWWARDRSPCDSFNYAQDTRQCHILTVRIGDIGAALCDSNSFDYNYLVKASEVMPSTSVSYCGLDSNLEQEPGTIDCSDAFYWRRVPDKQLLGGIQTIIYLSGLNACKNKCRFDDQCVALNYDENVGECQLHTIMFEDEGAFLRASRRFEHWYLVNVCEVMPNTTSGSVILQTHVAEENGRDRLPQFIRWTKDSPEAVAMVGMGILALLLLIIIFVLICLRHPRSYEITGSKSDEFSKL